MLHPLQQPHLHRETGALQGGVGHLLHQRRQHLHRVTGEEHVVGPIDEGEVEIDQVVGHVLEEAHRRRRVAEYDRLDHMSPVGVLGGDDVLNHGVLDSGRGEVMGVERLVDDRGVGTLPERVHQGGRDVAGTRPQADPLRGQTAVSRSTRAS